MGGLAPPEILMARHPLRVNKNVTKPRGFRYRRLSQPPHSNAFRADRRAQCSRKPARPLGSACTPAVGRGLLAEGHPRGRHRRPRRQHSCPINRRYGRLRAARNHQNDDLAALVGRYPGRIYGLASVDAYDGDRSAREAERAIRDLGLRGLFVDCARGDVMIDAPQARPTLEVAAKLGVPVFVHPVAPQSLTRQMVPYGLIGTLFARGTANSASLIALVEGGVFSQLPGLRIVVTALAFAGLAMAAGLSSRSLLPSGAIDVMRKHVFIDTMGFHRALIRASVDLLGADKVMAGSDWPIANDGPIRGML